MSFFYEQYDNNANSEYEKKQQVNENIKYQIFEHANFDDIIIFFHVEVSQLEQFNDEKYTRHDMTSLFCNICKKNYVNNDDRVRLNNHMFNIHSVDIKSNQTMNRKRYINWMKHAVLHVIIIRESSSKREYVIIQTRLYDQNNEKISICIDTDFSVNFIDESLLSENNLWNRLHNCHSIIVRDIANKRIVDKQMNIFLYITTIDESLKRLEVKTYVNKDIQTDVILDMNELEKIENDIVIWLDRKKMQLNNCHVTINFTSRDSQSVIFFADTTSRNDYTDRRFCFKSFDDKYLQKSVRFAEITIKILYKSIRFSDTLTQINSIKIEKFQAIYDSNIAKLKLFAIARNFAFNFASNFANVFNFFHQRVESTNFNWRARFSISNRFKRFTMNSALKNRRRNLSDSWRKLNNWWKNTLFFYFFTCITNRFLKEWIACLSHATQRERCDFFRSMTSVTINLHIELKLEYFDQKKLALSQNLDRIFISRILFSR